MAKTGPSKAVRNNRTTTFHSDEPVRVLGAEGAHKDFKITVTEPLPHRASVVIFNEGVVGYVITGVLGRQPITAIPQDKYHVEPIKSHQPAKTQAKARRESKPHTHTQQSNATSTPRTQAPPRAEAASEVRQTPTETAQPTPNTVTSPPATQAPPTEATASPEARAAKESPSATRGGDAVEGASPGLFEGIRSAADLADFLGNQIDQVSNASRIIDKELEDWVGNQGGLPSVLAATAAQTVLDVGRKALEDAKGRLDVLRLGEGIAQGTVMGVVEDVGRAADILLPSARALRAMGVAFSAAYGTVRRTKKIKEVQDQVFRIAEQVYKQQVALAMRNTLDDPMTQGRKADEATKEILKKKFAGKLAIYFEERTGTTKGTKGARTMSRLDVVFPSIRLALELKKSPKAEDEVQRLAFEIFCRVSGLDLRYIYGHR